MTSLTSISPSFKIVHGGSGIGINYIYALTSQNTIEYTGAVKQWSLIVHFIHVANRIFIDVLSVCLLVCIKAHTVI